MPEPAISGLQVGELVRLRSLVENELVIGVRRGADLPTLKGFAAVIDEIDSRIESRAASADRSAENRARVAMNRAGPS